MIEPSKTAAVTLSLLEDLNESDPAKRKSLNFRILTRRDSRELGKLTDRVGQLAEETDEQLIDALITDVESFLAARLLGWENQTDEQGKPLAFDVEDFDRVVTETDLIEIITRLRRENIADAENRKKSAWRLPSSTEPTASNADPGSNAAMNPATPTPSKSPAPNATGQDAAIATVAADT
tara:strand:- start:1872 stop:2411 length:540 start_codon:yes stop_codon:yes gene_type:complete